MLNSEQTLHLASLIAAAYLSENSLPPADEVEEPGARRIDPQGLSVLRDWVARQQVTPAELLFAASGQGVLPFRTPLAIPACPDELAGALLDILTGCDHAIRWAAPTDMERLLDLERLCWPAALATPADVIAQRIERYPEGQLVVEHAGKAQGVIYSQRIDSIDDLFGVTAATVDQLFSPHAAIVQLLAINIDPAVQDRRLGDRLLEFMLIYRALQEDIQSVVAVTRCLCFARQADMSLSEYIQARNDSGVLADPILRFHELHGARIAGLVPGYRPLDQDNRGHGVLVAYRPRDRHRTDLPVSECAAAADPRPAWSARDLGRIIEEAIRESRDIDAPGEFGPALPLMEMGLDSAAFLKLNDRLRHRLRVSLPPTFFFRHNTAHKIQQALVERFSPAAGTAEPQPAPAAPAALAQPQPGGDDRDIAVIGLACRLPGGIDTPEDLWSLLRSGGCVVTRRPEERWRWPEPMPDQERFQGIDYGAYLPDPWRFDASFFRIAPVEAESMDPHQRILLEVCWEALSSAGLRPSAMARSATGVFVGASNNGDFARLIAESHTAVEAHAGTGQSMAILANRISYFFDFEGPSLVIDTACSSSLVALHAAVQSLRQGECSRALVAGINLLLHPAPSLAYAAAGMLSRDGVCRTFDHRASGYVRGEGAVAVLLKPLRQARADGDVIHAVIQGSAVNHGGQASGLTVPHPGRQARLIRSAWADAGIEPTRLRYIETHGTGTPLGDPIEIEGIGEAFAPEPAANHASGLDCGLGSVKTNCGHLEAAAGLLGLLKVVMSLKHREWPALAQFERLNPKIDLGAEGPRLITERTPFGPARADRPVFAGVSSFGSGGTNAHVVLRDHAGAAPAPRGGSGESFLFAFSARSERKLLETCRSHLAWLDAWSEDALDLRQLSHWLRFGRESMSSRLACVASSRAELRDQLARFLQNPAAFRAAPPPSGAEDSAPLRVLARQWMDHALADWPPENAGQPSKPDWLYTLPHYPFEQTSYGPPGRRGSAAATPTGVAPNPGIPAATSPPPTEDQDPAATLLAPTWTALGDIDDGLAAARPAGERVFLLATSAPLRDSLARQSSGDGQVLLTAVTPGESPTAHPDFIEQLRPGDEVVYVAGAPSDSALSGQRVATLRTEGVGGFFALVKQLQERGLGDASLRLTVVTFRSLGVHPAERIDPSHTGLHGLAGVVGHEFPTWRVQALDLDDDATLLALCRKSLAGGFPAGPLALRAGVLWRQRFIPVAHTEALPPIRQNGVYLILGGSGGIGEAWTRHLVSRYQARVLWIGRRPLDEAIRGKIAAIGRLGPAPCYYPADATRPEALSRVLADIRTAWPDIQGVIHALMGPFDTSIRATPFAAFMDSLKPKMDACVHLVEGLGSWTPDFLLFLSSTVSLEQSGGYCGYASGCAFEDALAHSLARSAPWRVVAVNSAPWAVGSGERIAEAIKIRYRNSGHLPLATGEAIAGLEQAIGLPFAQAALVKARDLRNLPFADDIEHRIIAWREEPDAPPLEGDPLGCRYPDPPSRALSHFANPDFDAALLARIGEVLARYPLHARPEGPAELRVLPKYETWLGLIQERLAAAAGERDATVAEGVAEAPALSPARQLAEACLDALPRVLTGRTAATEILFPAGSMRMVEGIYRNNPVADYFNEVLAESLRNIIAAARDARPGKTLRILEIGAGTGGTTARVLPWISRHADGIAEYAYTDVSKRFLNHAEEVFGSEYPFVRPRLFDVGVPPARQGLMEGSYDILIATNTLHATPDIRATLAHAKALLRTGGLLFLNELIANSIFAHLTFGLLDGWWLARDRHFRIPHSPILAPDQWDWLLASCGFQDIRHPCQAASVLGQQIFIARSDGIAVTASESASPSTAPAEPRMNPTPESAAPAPISRIPSSPPLEELRPLCEKYLASVMAGILRMSAAEIDPTEPLGNYGIDSILTVQITDALKSRIPEVPSTLLFEAQTVRGLAAYLIEHHPARVAEALDVREPPAVPAAAARHPTPPPATAPCTPAPAPQRQAPHLPREPGQPQGIAIIGMSCRFPGCDNPDEFWELLAAGRSAIGEIPPDRWPIEGFYEPDPDRAIAEGKSYSKWGGFLKDITHFDPLFFNILPRDAELIDPQERLFLQAAWHALEDGGYTIERIGQEFNHSLGVYAGATRTGFDLFGPPLWAAGDSRYPHTTFASIANRVSFFLNARGPSIPVDTMCSSSLTAIHQACQGLLHGECRLAIAGGVNLYLHPSAYVGLSQLRMFSRDGVCRSFGKGGNGFVAGEGVACVLLKPLDQALADGDRIHAVIRGTQVNHGGRTHGYTVPNPKAQAELIRATLDRAGVSARRVSYVEAHGTGTELGDPIEISGLTQAFRRDTEDTGYCAIGSVKTNIGHLEATAGIAGLIKVVLQMQHRQLAPSLHAEEINPRIAFAETPFRVQTTLAEWRPRPDALPGAGDDGSRLAGVSSFGAGGANAHVLLEEFRAEPPGPDILFDGRLPFVFSARTREQLSDVAARALAYLEAIGSGTVTRPGLADLAFTLQTGREALAERLGFLAGNLDEVRAALAAYLEERESPELSLRRGHQRQSRELLGDLGPAHLVDDLIDRCFAQSIYETLVALWVKGVNIPWRALHERHPKGARAPRLVALPGYPFARTAFPLPGPRQDAGTTPAKLPVPPRMASPSPAPLAVAPENFAPRECRTASGLGLTDPKAHRLPNVEVPARVSITLPPLQDRKPSSASVGALPGAFAAVAEGILALDFGTFTAAPDTLARNLETLYGTPTESAKVLILRGLDALNDDWATPAEQASLSQTLAATPLICLAVLRGHPSRLAVSLARACDLVAFAEEGDYPVAALALSIPAEPGQRISGTRLREAGVTAAIHPAAALDAQVLSLAGSITQGTAASLAELKRVFRNPGEWATRGGRDPAPFMDLPPNSEPADLAGMEPAAARAVPLRSAVVRLEWLPPGIALLRLEDRVNRNTSSPEFVAGVIEAFGVIGQMDEAKVVVVTGFDNYFACGGTREGLLAIQQGCMRFTDEQSYLMPLLCDLPVIAAMQGHAIGAGWALGLFADLAIHAEESIYQSPYMLYGFTPGAGSTFIFPERLGEPLAWEILFSGREYRGAELARRHRAILARPRSRVLATAPNIARHWAEHPRDLLISRKRASVQAIRAAIPQVFERELALHDRTFVGNPSVLMGIERHFRPPSPALRAEPAAPLVTTAAGPRPDDQVQALTAWLLESLGDELGIPPAELNTQAAFIDLGIDSISAVTWVRKINQRFGLNLPATIVYRHPTVADLARHVVDRLPEAPRPAEPQPPRAELPAADRSAPPPVTAAANRESVERWLRASLARELLIAPEDIEDDTRFVDLGLDSVNAVTWIRSINQHFGVAIPATTVYAYPSLKLLAGYLQPLAGTRVRATEPRALVPEALSPERGDPPAAAENPAAPPPRPTAEPVSAVQPMAASEPGPSCAVAIIGMGGQFPQAPNLLAFWENLAKARDCVSEIPPSRWAIADYYEPSRILPGKTICKRMGVLEDIDQFDPLFFNISPAEAELMDPQQRLFLENSWHCIEDAGYDPLALAGSRCGIFVGCEKGDYSRRTQDQPDSAHGLIGESVAILPARVAYYLDLKGPCMAMDTACSASMVAINTACDNLALGHCDLALAGGVCVLNGPEIHIKMSNAGMLSPDGRCHTFDQRANGFVPGEGVGVVLLKPLAKAEADGDPIYAVIKAWGTNQDGRTNGITAPNPLAQAELERAVYQRYGIDPRAIGHVEAHGTGTALGDPIEIEGLTSAFRAFTEDRHFCALTSVKSNIGHLATAAGVAGVIKSALALERRQIPPRSTISASTSISISTTARSSSTPGCGIGRRPGTGKDWPRSVPSASAEPTPIWYSRNICRRFGVPLRPSIGRFICSPSPPVPKPDSKPMPPPWRAGLPDPRRKPRSRPRIWRGPCEPAGRRWNIAWRSCAGRSTSWRGGSTTSPRRRPARPTGSGKAASKADACIPSCVWTGSIPGIGRRSRPSRASGSRAPASPRPVWQRDDASMAYRVIPSLMNATGSILPPPRRPAPKHRPARPPTRRDPEPWRFGFACRRPVPPPLTRRSPKPRHRSRYGPAGARRRCPPTTIGPRSAGKRLAGRWWYRAATQRWVRLSRHCSTRSGSGSRPAGIWPAR